MILIVSEVPLVCVHNTVIVSNGEYQGIFIGIPEYAVMLYFVICDSIFLYPFQSFGRYSISKTTTINTSQSNIIVVVLHCFSSKLFDTFRTRYIELATKTVLMTINIDAEIVSRMTPGTRCVVRKAFIIHYLTSWITIRTPAIRPMFITRILPFLFTTVIFNSLCIPAFHIFNNRSYNHNFSIKYL